MIIQVSRDPPFVLVNGLRIDTAPPIGELLRVIGAPTRVDAGPQPAPYGHRNNQQHVFDSLGLYVNEHHHTRRAVQIGIALSTDERRYAFTPTSAFGGDVLLGGVRMPLLASEAEFLRAVPWQFERFLAGMWSCKFDGFFVGFDAVGARLRSGRRSRRRIVVDVAISWPHDPWGDPVGDGQPVV